MRGSGREKRREEIRERTEEIWEKGRKERRKRSTR